MAKWANDYPVSRMCHVLQVAKSAYYDWKQRSATVISAEEFVLCSRMKALFAQSRDSLGSRGMVRQLRKARARYWPLSGASTDETARTHGEISTQIPHHHPE